MSDAKKTLFLKSITVSMGKGILIKYCIVQKLYLGTTQSSSRDGLLIGFYGVGSSSHRSRIILPNQGETTEEEAATLSLSPTCFSLEQPSSPPPPIFTTHLQ